MPGLPLVLGSVVGMPLVGLPGVGLGPVVGVGPVVGAGGGVVGVTVTVEVLVGVGMTGSGSSGSAFRNSSQASSTASAITTAIATKDRMSAHRDAARSALGHGNGQIRNRPGRRRPSQ